jgi:hypothetical protein
MSRPVRIASVITAAVVAAIPFAFAGVFAGSGAAAPTDELQSLKAATARYHSFEQAEQAGYSAEGEPCVSSPLGAMGIHAVNHALTGDLSVDPLRPEVLLYLPTGTGSLKLVGVEYFVVALANTDSGPRPWFGPEPPPLGFANPAPTVFGQTFDGPMEGHNPEMPWHYDLHAWVWADNPAGVFAQFNPSLACPS